MNCAIYMTDTSFILMNDTPHLDNVTRVWMNVISETGNVLLMVNNYV